MAIDASDMPAYANGQRFKSKGGPERETYSDPDASWGHRSAVSTRKGGGFYGYRLHMAVCAKTDLPLAWRVETARSHETNAVAPLLDKLHTLGIDPETCAMDKGYDNVPIYDGCEDRDVRPIIPLRQTPAVKRGEHKPLLRARRVAVRRGRLQAQGDEVALPDRRVQARQPVGQGRPAAPADPARDSALEGPLPGRASVEREFGRLKHEWALAPLRVRGIERVRLHADLTILAKLSCALARARAVPLAA